MIYPWHQPLWQQLQEQIAQQRLPHALLLTGPAGVGKLAFAQALARYLLVDLQGATLREKNANLFDAEDGHPDYRLLEPEGKLGLIKVDMIREVVDFLTETAQQGGYRIVILQHAERMNVAASNALLKTLEEPGAKTVLLLLSSQPALLLPTVRSRCQVLAFHVDEKTGQDW